VIPQRFLHIAHYESRCGRGGEAGPNDAEGQNHGTGSRKLHRTPRFDRTQIRFVFIVGPWSSIGKSAATGAGLDKLKKCRL
jgi:hypothetical protein